MVVVVLFIKQDLQSVSVSELITQLTQHQELLHHAVNQMETLKQSSATALFVTALTLMGYVFLEQKKTLVKEGLNAKIQVCVISLLFTSNSYIFCIGGLFTLAPTSVFVFA